MSNDHFIKGVFDYSAETNTISVNRGRGGVSFSIYQDYNSTPIFKIDGLTGALTVPSIEIGYAELTTVTVTSLASFNYLEAVSIDSSAIKGGDVFADSLTVTDASFTALEADTTSVPGTVSVATLQLSTLKAITATVTNGSFGPTTGVRFLYSNTISTMDFVESNENFNTQSYNFGTVSDGMVIDFSDTLSKIEVHSAGATPVLFKTEGTSPYYYEPLQCYTVYASTETSFELPSAPAIRGTAQDTDSVLLDNTVMDDLTEDRQSEAYAPSLYFSPKVDGVYWILGYGLIRCKDGPLGSNNYSWTKYSMYDIWLKSQDKASPVTAAWMAERGLGVEQFYAASSASVNGANGTPDNRRGFKFSVPHYLSTEKKYMVSVLLSKSWSGTGTSAGHLLPDLTNITFTRIG